MATENDRLLELVCGGDTLQALNIVYAADSDESPRLAANRALYGPSTDVRRDLVRNAEQDHRAALAGADDAERAVLLYNLGCFALMQDDVQEALLRFSEVLELDPGNTMARHNLAYSYELMAETEDARREYEAALAQHPESGLTQLNLAQLKMQEGDYEDGLADLEALHDRDPDNMGVLLYFCRGLLLRGGGKDLERVLALLSSIPGADDYVDLQECGAYALFAQGEMDGAEAAFRKLLETNEDNPFALAGMIKVLGQRSDFAGLKPYAERLAAQDSSEAVSSLLAELSGN